MNAAIHSAPGRQAAGWDWLRGQDPDIALLQEVRISEAEQQGWASVIFTPKYGKAWGSAVVTRSLDYRQYEPSPGEPWLREIGGAACVAVPVGHEGPLLVSIHSSATAYSSAELASLPSLVGVARCHDRQLWEVDVAVHELKSLLAGRRFIVGGDLNSALMMDDVYGVNDNRRLFANMADAGFVDIRPRHVPDEQRTFFQAGKRHYQLDHVFADTITEATVADWRVETAVADTLNLSDHAAIVTILEPAR